MKSSGKIHTIVERMPVEDRKAVMEELLELRFMIAEEVIGAMRNANKMIQLMYKDNGRYFAQGKFREE